MVTTHRTYVPLGRLHAPLHRKLACASRIGMSHARRGVNCTRCGAFVEQ
jgi:hypothetical protein